MATTINGTTGVSQVQNSTVTDSKLSLTANSAPIKTALNASGDAPIYACRAWVNFNGTGTVAIRASGNVSSITDNGVGDYTVNFTAAMPDANYCMAGSGEDDDSVGDGIIGRPKDGYKNASAIRVKTLRASAAPFDMKTVYVNFIR
jgi:hypothetical protein